MLQVISSNNIDLKNAYQLIFNDQWYPKNFINEGYSIFFFALKEDEHLMKHHFIKKLIDENKNEEVFFKYFDMREEDVTKYYKVSSDTLMNSNIEIDFLEYNLHNFDQGFTFFSDNGLWAYYYGEDFFNNRPESMEEFELFIVRTDFESKFETLLSETIGNIKFSNLTHNEVFQESEDGNNESFPIKEIGFI